MRIRENVWAILAKEGLTLNRVANSRRRKMVLLAASFGTLVAGRWSSGGTYTHAPNTTNLDTSGAWSYSGANSGVPTSSDYGLWDFTTPAVDDSANIGTGLNVYGLQVGNPGGPITVGATGGGSLMIGAGGIDLTGASQNFTSSVSVALSASQAWNVGSSGKTITVFEIDDTAASSPSAVTLSGGNIGVSGYNGIINASTAPLTINNNI